MIDNFCNEKIIENMRGGLGKVKIEKANNLLDNMKIFARITIFPGSSIGYHKHENDEEIIYVLSGKGQLLLEDEKKDLKAGMINTCMESNCHGIYNNSKEDLILLAVIMNK